jgi:CRP/FNR family transcriptional regulator, cyclic AMP receptor protein
MSLLMSLQINQHPVTEFTKGDVIVKEATPGGKVFILAEGSVEVTLQGKQIATANAAGEIFGEIASIRGRNYGATVTASEDSKFYIINDFVTFLRQNSDDALSVLKMLCERIDNMNQNAVS